MKRATLAITALTLGVLAMLPGPPAAGAEPPLDATTWQRVDAFLAQEMREADIPGMAVAIVVGDEIAHTAAFGVADASGRPVTADTPFALGSVSKALTATAIMQLVEAGLVELDAPVHRYLPWFSVGGAEESSTITLRQLLHHTAGLPFVQAPDEHDDGALERWVRSLATVELRSIPGEEYFYTNTAYDTLAVVVQQVSGLPFDEYLAENIFEPLDMAHSHALVEHARNDGASEGFYRWLGLNATPTRVPHPRAQAGSGTSFSSANDMGRWLIAHLNGATARQGQILSSESMALLHTPAVAVDASHGYAMGWFVRPLWEAIDPAPNVPTDAFAIPALIEHGGALATAHTYAGFVPQRGWGFVMLMNVNDETIASRYIHVEMGLQAILSGRDPGPAQPWEAPFIRYGKQLAVLLLALELASLVWALDRIRRWRRAERVPRTRRRVALAILAPLALDLVILALAFVVAPAALGAPLTLYSPYNPDLPFVVLPALVLAGVWGPIRTVVFGYLLWGRQTAARGRAASAS